MKLLLSFFAFLILFQWNFSFRCFLKPSLGRWSKKYFATFSKVDSVAPSAWNSLKIKYFRENNISESLLNLMKLGNEWTGRLLDISKDDLTVYGCMSNVKLRIERIHDREE